MAVSRGRPLDMALEDAHEAGAMLLAVVAGGLPEREGVRLVPGDDGVHAAGALRGETALALADERGGEAAAVVVREHGEPVERAAPPVPAGDQRADELAALLGDDQSLGVAIEETPERLLVVRDAGE
jgi:hypothetical protein